MGRIGLTQLIKNSLTMIGIVHPNNYVLIPKRKWNKIKFLAVPGFYYILNFTITIIWVLLYTFRPV